MRWSKLAHRMASLMTSCHAWNIRNPITRVHCAPAEIHVLEPNGKEALVKTAQLSPNILPDHKEGARRLVDRACLIEITIQITIPAIHGVQRPQPVYAKQFKDQCSGRGETPDRKPHFSAAGFIHQPARRDTLALSSFDQFIKGSNQMRIRIQDQDKVAIAGFADPLVETCREAPVFWVGDQAK